MLNLQMIKGMLSLGTLASKPLADVTSEDVHQIASIIGIPVSADQVETLFTFIRADKRTAAGGNVAELLTDWLNKPAIQQMLLPKRDLAGSIGTVRRCATCVKPYLLSATHINVDSKGAEYIVCPHCQSADLE